MRITHDPRLPGFLGKATAATASPAVEAAAPGRAEPPATPAPLPAQPRHGDGAHVVDFPLRPAPKPIFSAPPPRITGTPGPHARPGTPQLVPESRTAPATRTPKRRPLGEILVEQGALSPEELDRVLALQEREEARFGDILLAREMVSEQALYRALSQQYGCTVADLATEPPDARLVDAIGAENCVRNGVLPWKRVAGATVVICSRPAEFAEISRWLPDSFGTVRLAVAPESAIQTALIAARRRALAGRAETRVAASESCRTWRTGPNWRFAVAGLLTIAAIGVLAPIAIFLALTLWAVLTLLVNTGLKAGAALLYRRALQERAAGTPQPDTRATPVAADALRLPTVSILVPLFRETEIAGRLIRRLDALDYPRELLEICLVVEADDNLTRETLARSALPPWMRQVIVPEGAVRTKPRALNFALDFCHGSIIGVYDAEDAPVLKQSCNNPAPQKRQVPIPNLNYDQTADRWR